MLNFVGISWKQEVGCICDRHGPILSYSHSLKMTRQALWTGIAKWIQSAAPLFTDVGDSGPNMVILIIKYWRWHKVFPRHSFIWSHKYTRNKLSPATKWFFPHFWYMCPLPPAVFATIWFIFNMLQHIFPSCHLLPYLLLPGQLMWVWQIKAFPPLFVLHSNLFSGALISWWAD